MKKTPVIGPLSAGLKRRVSRPESSFTTSPDHWEKRYAKGGNSGPGSYNRLAEFKARVISDFIGRHHEIQSVAELGSGDGANLALMTLPRYTGYDVSPTSVQLCKAKFAHDPTKSFRTIDPYAPETDHADLALSLDVIFHLVEDEIFSNYMRALFETGRIYVIVYSSNYDESGPTPHVRHRNFSRWIEESRGDFVLEEKIENAFPYDPADPDNTSFADFYFYRKRPDVPSESA